MKYIAVFTIFFALACASCAVEDKPLYKDPSQPVAKRVADLMSRMTIEEKVGQMNQYVSYIGATEEQSKRREQVIEVARKGHIGSVFQANTAELTNDLQRAAMETRLQIPILVGADAVHGACMIEGTTIYPMPINFAATWDPADIHKTARQTALELRAMGSHWSFFPNADLAKDPRWGRVGETFGEDPLLVSDMVCSMINGYQLGDFTGTDRVLACANHFIAGGATINGVNFWGSDIGERTLRDQHLKPFRDAIRKANLFSVMGGHNTVNDIPMHANRRLLTDIMRGEYGFKGFYVSDFTDLERLHTSYKTAHSRAEANVMAINAGMDMHMQGSGFYEPMVEAVKNGEVPMSRINEAVAAILEAKFRLELFENPMVDPEAVKDVLRRKEHLDHALEVARRSIVLLENRAATLPIDKSKVRKILLTGPNANNHTVQGDWVNPQPADHITTIAEGLKTVADSHKVVVDYFDIGGSVKGTPTTKLDEAVGMATGYDMVVLVLGEGTIRTSGKDRSDGENADRTNINLLGSQLELAQRMKATGKPVVVVYINMRPISEPWISENVDALLEAWCPGEAGGQAVAEVLFGDVNPGGKLPVTILRSVGQVRLTYNMLPNLPNRGYVEEQGRKPNPLYPFGYGLSYTTFELSDPALEKAELAPNEETKVTVTVKNTGKVHGDEVVQLYLRDDYSSWVARPVKELKGYQRIALAPGESKKVEFRIAPDDLAFYDIGMNYIVEKGTFSVMVGNSSDDKDLKMTQLIVSATYDVKP